MKRKILANVLTLCMLFSMIPMTAFAADYVAPTNVTPAILHDTRDTNAGGIADDKLVAADSYKVTFEEPGKDDTEVNHVIKLVATDLRRHQNGDTTESMGYWAGVAIAAPQGATHMKAVAKLSAASLDSAFDSAQVRTITPNITADNKGGFVQYLDVDDAAYEAGVFYIKLQWYSNDSTPVASLAATVYKVDFSGVKTADASVVDMGYFADGTAADTKAAELRTQLGLPAGLNDSDKDTLYVALDNLKSNKDYISKLKTPDGYVTCRDQATANKFIDIMTTNTGARVLRVTLNPTTPVTANNGAWLYTGEEKNPASPFIIKEGTYTYELYEVNDGTTTLDTSAKAVDTEEITLYKVEFKNGNDVLGTAAYGVVNDKVTVPTISSDTLSITGWKIGDKPVNLDAGKYTIAATDATNNVITLQAVTAKKITVSFDKNGGTLTQDPITKGAGTTIDLSDIVPSRDGYIFQGWKVTGAADSTANKTEFKIPADASADITLVAVWTSDKIASAGLKVNDSDAAAVPSAVVTPSLNGNTGTLTISGAIPAITGSATYKLSYVTDGKVSNEATTITLTKAGDGKITGTLSANIVIGQYTYSTVEIAADLVEATVKAAASATPEVPTTIPGTSPTDRTELNTHFETPGKAVATTTMDSLVKTASDPEVGTDVLSALENDLKDQDADRVEVYLEITPTGYVSKSTADADTTGETERSLKLEITPMARVVELDGTPITTTPVEVTGFVAKTEAEAVTITVPVPNGFILDAEENSVFVKHYNKDGSVDITKATYDKVNKTVQFKAYNFSEYEIVVDGRKIAVTFGEAPAVDLTPDKVGTKISDLKTAPTAPEGKVFSGWGIGSTVILGKDATLTSELLDTLINHASATGTIAGGDRAITLVAIFVDTPKDNNSGGGGGVSSNVTIDRPTNGKVTVTPTAPSKGATVTINLTPDTGYAVGTVTVTDKDGKAVDLTKVDDTHYTFVMPDGKVTVKATFTATATTPDGFTDVPADAYYADAVKWAVDKGITNGLTATTFGPNNSCTRGQMVTFLWRAAGSPAATGTNSFTDVASGEYYYNAVLWAVEKGITNGTTATTFSPNATVNRGQTVTFLYRYAESPAATGASSFTDVAADAYYTDAVKWAVAEGITNGTSDTTFAPASNCTRGQIVTFLYRQMAE